MTENLKRAILDVDRAVYEQLAETGFENPPIVEEDENYMSPRMAAVINRVREILNNVEKPCLIPTKNQ